MSQITQYDWNNPTIPALRPASGGKINYVDEPGFPGLKTIFDQYQDEWRNLRNKMDADVVGQGIQFGNIGNGAVRAENIRPRINQGLLDKPFSVSENTGNYFTQTDGQTQKYLSLGIWQETTAFRNFIAGTDNITNDLQIDLHWGWWDMYSGIQSLNAHPTWYAAPADLNSYKNVWIEVSVGSDNGMTGRQVICNKGFGQNSFALPTTFSCTDSTTKLYQNPWYEVRFYMKKAVNQGAGSSFQMRGVGTLSTKSTVTNQKI